jgi:hypothetical protein
MTILEKLEQIINNLELAKRDAEKADKGNVSAGIRLRKDASLGRESLKELGQLVLTTRKESE